RPHRASARSTAASTSSWLYSRRVYLGALLLGLAAERLVTLRSFGIDWRLLAAIGALLFVAGAAMMVAAAGLFRRLGTNVPPSQPTTLIATTGPYRWTRNPMYLGMALIYAGLAIGFDGPIPSPCSRWC